MPPVFVAAWSNLLAGAWGYLRDSERLSLSIYGSEIVRVTPPYPLLYTCDSLTRGQHSHPSPLTPSPGVDVS